MISGRCVFSGRPGVIPMMMVNTAVPSDESLRVFLLARARAASDGRLILDVAVGLLVALALLIWHPRPWLAPFAMGSTLAAFGAWGLADRELAERAETAGPRGARALRMLRAVFAVAGGLAAVVACFALLALALGTSWKS